MSETIVAAALRVPVGEPWTSKAHNGRPLYPDHLIVTAPPPARHASLLHPICDTYHIGIDDQGFITSTGRYVGREEALRIAKASGQPMIDHPSRSDTWLFSEDLW